MKAVFVAEVSPKSGKKASFLTLEVLTKPKQAMLTRIWGTKKVHRIRARAQQVLSATPQCEKRIWETSVLLLLLSRARSVTAQNSVLNARCVEE